MSFDVFDPDSEIVPDFCRDVLGIEAASQETSPEAALTGSSFLLIAYGLFTGLLIGFALGALAQLTLLAGR
jgi:hypothetical protein